MHEFDLLVHFLIGLVGAGTGWMARGFCQHVSHRVMLTLMLVAGEAYVTVGLVG